MKRLLFVLFHPDLVLDFIQEARDVFQSGQKLATLGQQLATLVELEVQKGTRLYIQAGAFKDQTAKFRTEVTEAAMSFKKLLGEP